jgi:hypothetical protein
VAKRGFVTGGNVNGDFRSNIDRAAIDVKNQFSAVYSAGNYIETTDSILGRTKQLTAL